MKKLIGLFVMSAIGMVILAGCSDGSDNSDSTGTSGTTTTGSTTTGLSGGSYWMDPHRLTTRVGLRSCRRPGEASGPPQKRKSKGVCYCNSCVS